MTTRSLILTADQVEQLRNHLLRDDGLERAAYIYCSPSGDDRLLAEELVLINDDQLAAQSATECRPTPRTEYDLVQDCTRRDMHPCVVHSHPFDTTQSPDFSPRDDDLMDGLYRFITGHAPETATMFAVLGDEGITATVDLPDTDHRETLPVTVLGNRRLDTPLRNASSTIATNGSDIDTDRFDRGIRALGEAGQQRLADTHIAVVGCGGLGDIMAIEFAMYGVGKLTLIDPDVVETSNQPRLISATEHHTGRPKVTTVKQQLWKANPAVDLTTVQKQVENAAEALHQADLIVAGVDRVSTREWLNAFAIRHLKPYIDAGVIITTDETDDDTEREAAGRVETMDGYIQTIIPGVTACWDCLNRGDDEQARIERLSDDELEEELERGYIDETQLSPAPAVVPLNGEVASKTVRLVAKLVTGYAEPADYLHVETVNNDLTTVTTRPRDTCPTCGETGILGRGDRKPTEADLAATEYDIDLQISAEDTPTDAPHTDETDDRSAVAAAFAALFDTP